VQLARQAPALGFLDLDQPARHRPKALGLLRELPGDPLMTGDVSRHADHAAHGALRPELREHAPVKGKAAARQLDGAFVFLGLSPLVDAPDHLVPAPALLRHAHFVVGLADEGFGVKARVTVANRIDVQEAAVAVVSGNDIADVLDQRAEVLLAFAKRLLGGTRTAGFG